MYHQQCWDCLGWTTPKGKGNINKGKGKSKGKGKGFGKPAPKPPTGEATGRRGRWNRFRWKSGQGEPEHWHKDSTVRNNEFHEVHEDDDMGDNFMIGTPPDDSCKEEVDMEKVSEVIRWLKAKGADKAIIGSLAELKAANDKPDIKEQPKDPWRCLQSCKDKMRTVKKQLESAVEVLERQRSQFEEAQAWHDELVDRRDNIGATIDELQIQVGSSDLKIKVSEYESLITTLQEKMKNGLPEDPKEKAQVYNLVFRGNVGKSDQDSDKDDLGDDTSHLVDREGFGFVGKGRGFGPAQVPKSNPSPYAKEQHSSTAKGKGPAALAEPTTGGGEAGDHARSPDATQH